MKIPAGSGWFQSDWETFTVTALQVTLGCSCKTWNADLAASFLASCILPPHDTHGFIKSHANTEKHCGMD